MSGAGRWSLRTNPSALQATSNIIASFQEISGEVHAARRCCRSRQRRPGALSRSHMRDHSCL
eukprot:6091586-Alexandrium_andersonii.AAC.1